MTTSTTGWQSEVIRQLETQLRTCVIEATVSGDWPLTTRSQVRNLPFISVKFGPEFWNDVYDCNIGSLEGSGTLADYPFSLHIFHSNCKIDGEEKGKYAQDIASRIITCLTQSPAPIGADIYDLTARESEPSAGAHRISRCIIEGRIQIKRIG